MRPHERGSATVLAVAAVGVLLSVLFGAAVVAGVVLARHRAESAADLGALAGAKAVQGKGPSAGCARALDLVARNGATGRCRVAGEDVVVTASVPLPPLARRFGAVAEAVARAGPATDPAAGPATLTPGAG